MLTEEYLIFLNTLLGVLCITKTLCWPRLNKTMLLIRVCNVCVMFLFFITFFGLFSLTDTAAKIAATKVVATDANATAIDVLERLGDLNLRLRGLQQNYSELEDTVNAANQMIQDPEKNSKVH